MNPSEVKFTAAQGKRKSCSGCCFEGCRVSVCYQAAAEAVKRQMRDCEHPDEFGRSIIYVLVEEDPRQQDLFT